MQMINLNIYPSAMERPYEKTVSKFFQKFSKEYVS